MAKNMLISFKKYLFPILILFVASCAQQVAPSGGPKDEKHPKFTDSKPSNKSVKFPISGQKITIKFDEFVRLKDASQQIVISPPPPGEKGPTILENGKNIEILFNEGLERNTTYTINFGNAITDIHEEMALPDFKYVFSTGENLDTNYIKGTIRNALTLKPESNVIVALYEFTNFSDTTIYKKKPSYFIRTKEDGTFNIENIPISSFFMLAYKKEGDIKFAKGLELAMFKNPINIVNNINEGYESYLFKPDTYIRNKLLNNEVKAQGKYAMSIYKPEQSKISAKSKDPYYLFKEKGFDNIDTFYLYTNVNEKDSFNIFIENPDTTYTLQYKQKKKLKNPIFEVKNINPDNLEDTLLINFSVPYKTIISDSIICTEDTNLFKPIYVAFDEEHHQFIKYWHKWKDNTNYTFLLKDSSIIDIFGQKNQLSNINFITKSTKDYANLIVNISLIADGQEYILQLVDKDEKVIREKLITKSTEVTFNGLSPMECRIKIIQDKNRNGIWDNGNLELNIFPERVYYYPESLVLRAYWDLEQSININSLLDNTK